MRLSILPVACLLVACGKDPATKPDAPAVDPDGGVPPGDGGLVDGPGDDGAGDAAVPPDASPACTQPAELARVSADTRPGLFAPLVATNGTSTLALWSVHVADSNDRTAWVTIENGAVTHRGELPDALDAEDAQLVVFGSRYILDETFHGTYMFDGTAWSKLAGFGGDHFFVTPTQLVGIDDQITSVSASVYDGTTVTSSLIMTHRFDAAAMSPSGQILVIAHDTTYVYAALYDGTAWSAETPIMSTPSTVNDLFVASNGTTWAIAWANVISGGGMAIQTGPTTWTSTNLPTAMLSHPQGFAGNAGAFAVTDIDGDVAVYKTGWTVTKLGGSVTGNVLVAPYLGGFAYFQNATFATFDGAAWSTPISTVALLPTRLLVDGARLAFTAGGGLHVFDGTAWTDIRPPTGTRFLSDPIVAGSKLAAIYTSPGHVDHALVGIAFEAPLALPFYATSGAVVSGSLARAPNGHVLAAWAQWQDGGVVGFAAEHDGCRWSTPVEISQGLAAQGALTAVGNTFVGSDATAGVRVWMGAGFSDVTLAKPTAKIASDGTTVVAAWQASGGAQYATSTDGTTWSTPAAFDTNLNVGGMASGSYGVLAWTQGGAPGISARVWRAGAWSDAIAIATNAFTTCTGVVGDDNAVVACNGSTRVEAAVHRGGAWTAVPTGLPGFSLGSDGHDARLDYGQNQQGYASAILHDGVWSAPIPLALTEGLSLPSVTGHAGEWLELGPTGDQRYYLGRATGATKYSLPTQFSPDRITKYYQLRLFEPRGGSRDAMIVVANPAYSGVPLLRVALGL